MSSDYVPGNLGEELLQGAFGETGTPYQETFFESVIGSVPTIPATIGNQGRRTGNTVLRGGWAEGGGRLRGGGITGGSPMAGRGTVRQTIGQNNPLNPRNWGRFGTGEWMHIQGAVNPGGMEGLGRYSPNPLANAINAIDRGLRGEGKIAQKLLPTKMAERAKNGDSILGGTDDAVTRGFYGRVSAAAKMANMSDKSFAAGRRTGNVANFLNQAGMAGDDIVKAGRTATAQGTLVSGSGRLTGRVGGFTAAAKFGRLDKTITKAGLSEGAKVGSRTALRWAGEIGGNNLVRNLGTTTNRQIMQAAGKTAGKAATRVGGAKALAKGGALVGARMGLMAVPGVNLAMTAWMAFDLAKLGVKSVGHIAKFGGEAVRSFQGGLNTGIMGQGFKDTEATMTSRARGVSAIQNSRLNARSILGSEAGSMAAHFG